MPTWLYINMSRICTATLFASTVQQPQPLLLAVRQVPHLFAIAGHSWSETFCANPDVLNVVLSGVTTHTQIQNMFKPYFCSMVHAIVATQHSETRQPPRFWPCRPKRCVSGHNSWHSWFGRRPHALRVDHAARLGLRAALRRRRAAA